MSAVKPITVEFHSEKSKELFASWLSGSGEQDFFNWCEVHEHQVHSLQYRAEDRALPRSSAKRYGPFLADSEITVHDTDPK